MASTIDTTFDIWGFVLATFPINLVTSQKKPGSQSTDAAQDLMVDECGKKNTLCTNSYAFESLQIVLSPDCSDMNTYLWAGNFSFGFQTNTLKHHQNCGLV